MIILHDAIEINTSPEMLFDWFINLDKNFPLWHPNHIKFLKITGGMNLGDVVRFEERISGKWFKFNVIITKIETTANGWIIEAKTPPFATLEFKAEARGDNCLFTHTEIYGFIPSKNVFFQKYVIPLLIKILNPLYRFDLIQRDIIEDNINLKQIMENNYLYHDSGFYEN
jgi:hypothetical protein